MSLPYYPRISIVTPSFNQGEFIEETINSILNQNYPNLEYIIMDGGSTDKTLSILQKYSDYLHFWISEKDLGQADALNKGFKRATGDIFAYLNSDDLYLNNIFWEVARLFVCKNFLWLSTKVSCGTSIEDSTLFDHRLSSYPQFCAQQTIGQQGVFWSEKALNKPWFDANLRYTMDHKFFISLYKKCGPPTELNIVSSFFRFHPNAKTSNLENILIRERRLIGEEAARKARNKNESLTIKKEIKRLELKIEGNNLLKKIANQKSYNKKLILIFRIFTIILKAPFPLRDRVFSGYIIRAIKNLIPLSFS